MSHGAVRRWSDALAWGLGAVAVLVAVPSVLVWAWYEVAPATWLFDVLAVAAWVAWLGCCLPFGVSVVRRVRRRDTTSAHGAHLVERLAARTAAAIVVALLAPASVASAAPDAFRGPAVVAGMPGGSEGTVARHLVQPGETLAGVALEHLGDAGAWAEVAALNAGRPQPEGTRLLDPSVLRPGWRLALPDAPARPADGRRAGRTGPRIGGRARGPELPELAVLGVGAFGAALMARRVRRRQRDRLAAELLWPPPAAAGVDLAVAVAPFAETPALDWVEAAVHLVAAPGAGGPDLRAVRAGPAGIDLWLGRPAELASPWLPVDDGGRVWRLPCSADLDQLAAAGRSAPCAHPVLVVVGADDEATWLVPVGPGSVLPVVGPAAPALLAAMRAGVQAWSWGDAVTVTQDPGEAERAGEAVEPAHPDQGAVVFVGDPDELSPSTRARCGVLTGRAEAASDLLVVVDRDAATLHPLGVTLRPGLLSPPDAATLDELTAAPSPAAPMPRDPAPLAPAGPSSPRSLRRPPPAPGAPVPELLAEGLGAGPVEVRLLTPVPRIDGLGGTLDPKRARRATELVAYLALHQPDPVTSDRLRTRVLGSADADAAQKTLFNTAGAARRALGRGPDGEPLLPPASRTGQYRLDPAVTVDVERLGLLAAAARRAELEREDPSLALALYRQGLDLIEGEPLAGLLSGYNWWSAEGHEGQLAATVVEAATATCRLAVGAGLPALAWWALTRARLVAPYSEALTCAAMRAAAAAGDADRLRREWADCLRRTDELDPGSLPAEETEALYAELRRRVPAASGG